MVLSIIYIVFTFVMILSHSPLTSPSGLVNVRGLVLLAEMVVEAASPPVLLLISLHRLDCGWAEYSSPCTFSKQVGCLLLRMLAGPGRHDSFQDKVRSRQRTQKNINMLQYVGNNKQIHKYIGHKYIGVIKSTFLLFFSTPVDKEKHVY